MSTIEEAREQARATMSDNVKLIADAKALVESWDRKGSWTPDSPVGMVMQLADALRALLDATEPSTVAVKTEFRVLDAPKDCDYHEGFEEGVKVGRAGSGPRPITDEMVEAADFAIMPYWGERYPSGSLTTEIARAALEAAMAVNRG